MNIYSIIPLANLLAIIHLPWISYIRPTLLQLNSRQPFDTVAAIIAYLVFAISILYIGLPLMHHYKSPWIAGSIMGIVIYGIFDLTNRAIWSEKYPYWLVMGDIIWGCIVISIVLYLIHTVI